MIMRYKNGDDDETPGKWEGRMKSSLHTEVPPRGGYSGLISPQANRFGGAVSASYSLGSAVPEEAKIVYPPADVEEIHSDALAAAQSVVNCSAAFNGEMLRGGRLEVPLKKYLEDRIAFRDAVTKGDVNASMPVDVDIMHAILKTSEYADSSKR